MPVALDGGEIGYIGYDCSTVICSARAVGTDVASFVGSENVDSENACDDVCDDVQMGVVVQIGPPLSLSGGACSSAVCSTVVSCVVSAIPSDCCGA